MVLRNSSKAKRLRGNGATMDGMQNFNLPQPVQVTDTASAEDFHRKLRMRESALHEALEENETVTMDCIRPLER